MPGSIDIAIGPMWAEKTTYAISRLRKAEVVGNKALIILYSEDNRYNSDSGIVTHSGIIYKSADVERMNNIPLETCEEFSKSYDLVVIDEGQFFSGLSESALALSRAGCDVVITCLSGDYNQQMFPEIIKLIPYANKIHHFRAICMQCKKNKAPFTIRLDKNNTEQKDIGGRDKYMSVCSECILLV